MYALLIASALVWGWVFVKIFDVVFQGDEVAVKKVNKMHKSGDIEKKDTFELLLNYKDPFLKTRARPVLLSSSTVSANNGNNVVQRSKSQVVKAVKEEKVIDWSFIKYKGRITRQATGKVLSLINIGGGDYSLEDGKEVQQVLLIKSYSDSIHVKFDGVKKYIKRNQN